MCIYILMTSVVSYFTHDNGSRPYRVTISATSSNSLLNDVTIQSTKEKCGKKFYTKVFLCEIFIGKSMFNAMTDFSGGYGDAFDGNSFVINMDSTCDDTHKYMYVGNNIFVFSLDAKIISYVSPVGNNDVPYPYAICENGDIVLMIENVIICSTPELSKYMSNSMNDPYKYYYNRSIIVQYDEPLYNNINSFYVGDEQFGLIYNPNPSDEYNRFMGNSFRECNVKEHGISIITNGTKQLLNKNEFIMLVTQFGEIKKFKPLQILEVLNE
jgi:hypothetical protein